MDRDLGTSTAPNGVCKSTNNGQEKNTLNLYIQLESQVRVAARSMASCLVADQHGRSNKMWPLGQIAQDVGIVASMMVFCFLLQPCVRSTR
jgi:hypothetical protein